MSESGLSKFARQMLARRGFSTVLDHAEKGYDLSSSLHSADFLRLVDEADLPVLAALVAARPMPDVALAAGPRAVRLRPVALLPIAAILGDIRSLNSREERFARVRREITDRLSVLERASASHSDLFVALDAWSGLFESAELFRAVEFILEAIGRDPALKLLGPSSVEIRKLSQSSSLPVSEVLLRLNRSGLDSVEGGFDIEVLEKAAEMGFRIAAGQSVGKAEDSRRIFVDHLLQFRARVVRLGRVDAWFPWSQSVLDSKPRQVDSGGADPLGARVLELIALGRLLLPDVVFIRAPITLLGPKVAHVALSFGANDLGFAAAERGAREILGIWSWEQVRALSEQGDRYRVIDDLISRPDSLIGREISNAT